MTPTYTNDRTYMPVIPPTAERSQSKPPGYREQAERINDITREAAATATNSPIKPYLHQRIRALRLEATALREVSRELKDNIGAPVSGQTHPYLPKAPSLFRDTVDELSFRRTRQGSTLRHVWIISYSRRKVSSGPRYSHPQPQSVRARMPHAVSLANTGFQALILCGPGIGFGSFTTVPSENPKALVPVANRPMIWYALDFCYRTGITDITIVTPPEGKALIEAALAQNPDLTSLPSPKPDLLAPKALDYNTPTADLLRLPEVQHTINQDFLILPCDIICDLSADALFELYLTSMAGMGGAGIDLDVNFSKRTRNTFSLGAEAHGRHGGLSIWYNTANREESVKREECDFMGTAALDLVHRIPVQKTPGLPDGQLRKLVWAAPMTSMLDDENHTEENTWTVRQSLLRTHGSVKCLTQYRDAHIYFFPHWVKDFAKQNEDLESISEDLVGTWVKSGWRKASYRTDHGAQKIFQRDRAASMSGEGQSSFEQSLQDQIDILSLSSTQVRQRPNTTERHTEKPLQLASRVQPINPEDSMISTTSDESQTDGDQAETDLSIPYFPPMLSYILSSKPEAPLVRRVDSTPLLLNVSLLLAKLPTLDDPNASPLSHMSKVHHTSQPPSSVRVTISTADTLIAPNTTLNKYCNIKEACIGSGCTIGSSVRIQRCVVMDGAVVGEKTNLTGCVVGKKAHIGKDCKLTNCEVPDGVFVPDGDEKKDHVYSRGGIEDADDTLMDDEDDE